jgi:hypothetical protein
MRPQVLVSLINRKKELILGMNNSRYDLERSLACL